MAADGARRRLSPERGISARLPAAGAAAYNQESGREHEVLFGFPDFLHSAQFWFSTLQTRQAEFFAMGVFMALTIFLQQESSAESKPVEASDEETGETDECAPARRPI